MTKLKFLGVGNGVKANVDTCGQGGEGSNFAEIVWMS